MADGKDTTAFGGFFRELSRSGIYKRTQGRWTRQVTAVAIAVLIGVGALVLRNQAMPGDYLWRAWIPLAVAALGVWIAYRVVNVPRFADFLIAVEAEMNKVTWPSKTTLVRGSIVVIAVMVFLAATLLLYDQFWVFVLSWIGVR